MALLAALYESALNDIRICEAVWKNTGNPIYVWQAISLSFRLEANRLRLCDGRTPPLPMDKAAPFPAWCMEYLSQTCFNISKLLAEVEEGETTGSKAKDRLPSELGFTCNNGNAFDRYIANSERRLDDLSVASLKERLCEKGAIEQATAEAKLQDERAMRKRLAEFKKVFAGTAEASPKSRRRAT